MPINAGKAILGFYILFVFAIMPLMSPLRALGVMEPGLVRNALLPPLLLLMVLAFGVGGIIRPRTYLHIILLMMFIFAATIGLNNVGEVGGVRSYLSHLFQVISAYVMLGVGWKAFDKLGDIFWRRLVIIALVATLVSTFITIRSLGLGDIGRFYTPAYGFVLIYAYGAIYSSKIAIVSFFGTIISNKRGVIVSVVMMLITQAVMSIRSQGLSKTKLLKSGVIGIIGLLILSFGSLALVMWASGPENSQSALGKAVNISYTRMYDTIRPSGEKDLNQITAGRVFEVDQTLSSLENLDYVFGSGAGWGVTLADGREVQNIHFTPLSLTAVFGLPAALLLYISLSLLVIKGTLRKHRDDLTLTERMAPLYLLGALVHSLVAYTLFIDWMVFFFAGVLIRSLRRTSPL